MGFFSFFRKKFAIGGGAVAKGYGCLKYFLKKSKFNLNSRGAILIEFAFGFSILIILIFYAHDLALLSQYNRRMKFVAEQMASMIQNVSQNRTDKRITANDLRYIFAATFQSIYPGLTMYGDGTGYRYKFGHMPACAIVYVKGESDGNVSCKWALEIAPYDGCTTPSSISFSGYVSYNPRFSE